MKLTLSVCIHQIYDPLYATWNECDWLHWTRSLSMMEIISTNKPAGTIWFKNFLKLTNSVKNKVSSNCQKDNYWLFLNEIFPAIKIKAFSSHIFVDFQVICFDTFIFQIQAVESYVTIKKSIIQKVEITNESCGVASRQRYPSKTWWQPFPTGSSQYFRSSFKINSLLHGSKWP